MRTQTECHRLSGTAANGVDGDSPRSVEELKLRHLWAPNFRVLCSWASASDENLFFTGGFPGHMTFEEGRGLGEHVRGKSYRDANTISCLPILGT